MVQKKNKTANRPKKEPAEKWHQALQEQTRRSIFAIISFVLGLFFSLAAFGKAGVIGNSAYKILEKLFGAGFFLVPVVFFIATVSLISSFRPKLLSHTLIGSALFLISSLGATDIIFGEKTCGYLGYLVSWPLLKLFDFWVSLIILAALFVISFLIMFDMPISIKIKKKEKEEGQKEKQKEIKEEPVETPIETTEAKAKSVIPLSAKIKEIIAPKSVVEAGSAARQDFTPPPLDLLESDKGKPSSGDIKANANVIKRTLQNFGIEVEMSEINIGPSVTQYTLKPAEGIKLSRIIALQNDLSLALAAYPLRIEAPIPGKSLVGIEIPNTTKTLIGLASLLSEEAFQKSSKHLLIAMGKDVTGKAVFANLAKMPHLLIAGATGTGKSILIHSFIISLLYHNSPESLRFILIDPKRVELTVYNKIPHLLAPVITDAKKSILTLKWACREMERRYEELLKAGVRDIAAYHEKHGDFNSMPYLIIIIDELADLMATYPREMEASIVRLAQMSRAVGIHLMVSTQRPSVEVITGLIKANITNRVALQVASQVDSRTILDMAGAEKLLGNGDMLYLAGDTAKPRRLQGPHISEKEIKKVVKHLAEQYPVRSNLPLADADLPLADRTSNGVNFEEENEREDELYEEARELVIKTGKASASYFQRRFSIGYARAARLLDILEERGVVGPGEGAKPREVLIKNIVDDNNKEDDDKISF
ncbi:MAG: hypothetical protein HY773_01830 [Candidatus Terrybacteria bacterium]|nr:hypothetical protein [Candidatus Terrybacteria bacterium]